MIFSQGLRFDFSHLISVTHSLRVIGYMTHGILVIELSECLFVNILYCIGPTVDDHKS